jgi:UPF0716 family protein affecting phage T7 exclusion
MINPYETTAGYKGDNMDLVKLQEILQIVGGVAVALPALVSALIALFMVIPGQQPEKFLTAVLDKLTKVVEVVGKFSKK